MPAALAVLRPLLHMIEFFSVHSPMETGKALLPNMHCYCYSESTNRFGANRRFLACTCRHINIPKIHKHHDARRSVVI